jgi:hypothetical protein
MRALSIALLIFCCLITPLAESASADDNGTPSILERYSALIAPAKPSTQSLILKVTNCSITCKGGGTSSQNCPTGKSCSCYCDGRDEAHCGNVSRPRHVIQRRSGISISTRCGLSARRIFYIAEVKSLRMRAA